MKRKKHVLELNIDNLSVNEKIALEKLFSKLEKLVGNTDINKIKIAINDQIFKYVDINEFKKIGNRMLKKVTIAITPALITITDDNKKLEILKKFLQFARF